VQVVRSTILFPSVIYSAFFSCTYQKISAQHFLQPVKRKCGKTVAGFFHVYFLMVLRIVSYIAIIENKANKKWYWLLDYYKSIRSKNEKY